MLFDTLLSCVSWAAVVFAVVAFLLWRQHPAPAKPLPPRLNDPRWGEHGYVEANGVMFHYVSKGDPKLPLMLCLHGFPESWYSWRWFLQAFSGTHRVVAVDLRGYGLTAHPEPSWWTAARDYNLGVLVEDVRALTLALGHERIAVLVGHDWGSMIVWSVISAHRTLAERAVVLSVPHPLLFRRNLGLAQALRSSYIALFQLPVLPEIILRVIGIGGGRAIPRAIARTAGTQPWAPTLPDADALAWSFSVAGTATAALNYYRALPPPRSLGLGRCLRQRLALPVLQLHGSRDRYLGRELFRGHEAVCEDYRLVVVEGASHWLQQDAVDAVLEAVGEFVGAKPGPLDPPPPGAAIL